MAELIVKWWVVDKLTALENELQRYKPFQGFEHAMYRKLVEVEKEIGKTPGVKTETEELRHFLEFEVEQTYRRLENICNPMYDGVWVGFDEARTLWRRHLCFCERLLAMIDKGVAE